MKEKLTSRKFWVAVISIIVGILSVFGADDSLIQLVSSIGLILIPAIIYIITEGKIDAAALRTIDFEQLLAEIKKFLEETDTTEDTTNTTEKTPVESQETR